LVPLPHRPHRSRPPQVTAEFGLITDDGFDWAVAPRAELVVADITDQALVEDLIRRRGVDAIIHFAGSIIVPESVDRAIRTPLCISRWMAPRLRQRLPLTTVAIGPSCRLDLATVSTP
jgi:hypothetical protein